MESDDLNPQGNSSEKKYFSSDGQTQKKLEDDQPTRTVEEFQKWLDNIFRVTTTTVKPDKARPKEP